MPLLTVVLVLIAVGVLVYLAQIAPWIDGTFKQIIKWVAICGVILWIASLFGLFNHLSAIHIGK
jgi:hypothetical protein